MWQGVFGACEFGLLFSMIFRWSPPLKNFKKWPILVSLRNWPLLGIAGTLRAAVCGTMLSDDCTLTAYYLIQDGISGRVFLKPASSAYFLSDFRLVPPLKNLKKTADFGVFAKLAIARNCRHF